MASTPDCCLCGEPCEPWHAPPTGYGNNPDPLGVEGDRCCNVCNDIYVIPARLGRYTSLNIIKVKDLDD